VTRYSRLAHACLALLLAVYVTMLFAQASSRSNAASAAS